MTTGPLVSVLMPVRNGGLLLDDAVHSIRWQTHAHWELLVLDDGGDDGALARIEALGDARIRILVPHGEPGIAARLNQGVASARGEFIARMDADDVSFPERFTEQLAMLSADARLDLVGTACVTMDAHGELTGHFPGQQTHAQICRRPWQGFHLAHPGWMGRRAWFRAHPYAEPAPYACEDQELLLRTHAHSRFGCTEQVLLAYRVRERMDWAKLRRTRAAWWQCQLRHFARQGPWRHVPLAYVCYGLRLLGDARLRWREGHLLAGDPVGVGVEMRRRWEALRSQLP